MQNDKESIRLNGESGKKSFIQKLFTQVRKMQGKDWISLLLLGVSFVPGKIWKMMNHHIWVISEYEKLARDNGYWFFKYIRENFSEDCAYYPIAKGCADERKIDVLGNRVVFSSFKHYMLFWAAEKQFTSSKNAGFPSRICEDLVDWNFHRFEYVMLNHGITKGKSTVVDASKTNYDFICTCSDLDRKIIIEDNGQPEQKVLSIGFARHDNLGSELLDKKMILIMPTWRASTNIKFVRNDEEKEATIKRFLQSDYYIEYSRVLNDSELIDYLKKEDYKLFFYLHDYAQAYSDYFKSKSNNIVIAQSNEYDIQTLLKRAALLITDYSSVCYDFAYMYKPVIYYQFDLEDFEYYQYKTGEHYSYKDNGVGEVVYEKDELIKKIYDYSRNGFTMDQKYRQRVHNYFKYHDKNNCSRIYERFCR